MSNPNDKSDKKGRGNVGISAEVPVAMRDALFRLAELTGTKASYHLRQALLTYLRSDDVQAQRAEAERFSDDYV